MKKAPFIIILLFVVTGAQAQRDTSAPQVINVKSSFKPVLRNAVKQNLSATPPATDTVLPKLTYQVPAQALFLAYEPVPLKPLALQVQNNAGWENSNYIKAGFGSLSTPYVSAGFSFGDGHSTSLGVFADYISSKGSIKNQEYSKIGIAVQGSKTTEKNFEFKGKIGYNQDEYFLYGYDHGLFNYTKDQVRQKFQTITLNAGMRNTMPTEFGLNYNPTLKSSIFTDNRKGSETNALLDVPLTKYIGKTFGVKLGLAADFTSYKKPGVTISNNIFYFKPAVLFKTPNININAGVTPAWEGKEVNILPDITADIRLQGTKFVAQLGWLGYYNKGSYQRWATFNPYILQPDSLPNAKVTEFFAGFKGTAGDHMVYAVKAGYYGYRNMALFINDTTGDGKSYRVVTEPDLQAFQVHAEFGVIQKEIFHFTAGMNLNAFTGLSRNEKPWGIIPMELTGSLRWQLFKDFWLKSDAFIWNGANFITKGNRIERMKPVVDLNAGLEFRITKQINLWFDANNLLNNKYQRWKNYETFGMNLVGGVKFNFATKKTSLGKRNSED
ncbi:MAG: hypothetical protein JNM68_03585 [Dinghuibacter sp.]|nr:hypothetical protein [Dinghuibacter sp.]